MAKEQSDYLAYLLRLWRTSERGKVTWRASLESVGNRERKGFASLDDLFDFLRQQTGAPTGPEGVGPSDADDD